MISAAIMTLGALVGATSAWWLTCVSSRKRPAPRLQATVACIGGFVGAVALRPEHYAPGPAWLSLTFAVGLVAIAACDLAERRIPNRLSYPLFVVALALCWAWPDRSAITIFIGIGLVLGIVVAMAAVGLLLTGPSQSASAVGVGDLKLVGALGAILGWPLLGTALAIGVVAGAIQALVAIVLGQRTLAYGAAFAVGGIVALLRPTTLT